MTQSNIQNNHYRIERSPLYRLRGKTQFEKVLYLNWDAVQHLLDAKHYRVWINDKEREILAPMGGLLQVHKRIAQLLARIKLPDYLYSQKGRSYADNAWFHRGDTLLIKTDIHRFYPSVTRKMVFNMLVDDFECAVDVARRLADVCCYKQSHLPTGSSLSGRVAFFAMRRMFDEIAGIAHGAKCKMTVYVDDVTVSGDGATKALLGEIRKVITQYGLLTKDGKSKTFVGNAAKMVTGVVIVKNEVRLPNARHKNIHLAREALQVTTTPADQGRAQRVLAGRLQEAEQVLRKR